MGPEDGEERSLRAALRQMEARRQAVERCGLVRLALGGGSGEGGVEDGIASVEQQLQAVLMQEEAAQAAASLGQGANLIWEAAAVWAIGHVCDVINDRGY